MSMQRTRTEHELYRELYTNEIFAAYGADAAQEPILVRIYVTV